MAAAHAKYSSLVPPSPRPAEPAPLAPVADLVAMPRIELPAGVRPVQPTDEDRTLADTACGWSAQEATRRAAGWLRDARRLQRAATRAPAIKRAKTERRLRQARADLIVAGMACGVAELLEHRLTPTPERMCAIRERCTDRYVAEPGRFAVDVENWVRDLQGRARLTRG